jgi:phage terminase Nu1 subunit (DNA packaging protein)
MNYRNSNTHISLAQAALKEDMRFVWLQHVYWTRMLIISIAEHLKDEADVTARLMQNPADIADVFAQYYPADTANEIERLLTEHLKIGAELITALRDGKTIAAAGLDQDWYRNAEEMARFFNSINPHLVYNDLRDMLFTHLDLTKDEAAKRLAGDYAGDIIAFDAVEREALAMADMFTLAIFEQFHKQF